MIDSFFLSSMFKSNFFISFNVKYSNIQAVDYHPKKTELKKQKKNTGDFFQLFSFIRR